MTPDLAQIGMTLMFFGGLTAVCCHGWWRNPADYLVTAWRCFSSTFSNGGRA